jgi:hypothetical protein
VPAYAIDDQTAIKVVDGAVEVISEGHWKLFTPSERVWECTGNPRGSPLRRRLAAARFPLRSRDPVERLVRDGVLSEKEA